MGGYFHFLGGNGKWEVPKVEVEVRGVSWVEKWKCSGIVEGVWAGGQLPQMGHLETAHAYR